MASIGERNALRVVRETKSGLHLDGDELGEILLPGRYIPKGTVPGDYLEVFVHRDSEDRIVATTEIPRACVGDFAALKVVSLHPQAGAFLDWGLSKDLLLPIREQAHRVKMGETVVAYVFLDRKSNRIVATTKLDRHLGRPQPNTPSASASRCSSPARRRSATRPSSKTRTTGCFTKPTSVPRWPSARRSKATSAPCAPTARSTCISIPRATTASPRSPSRSSTALQKAPSGRLPLGDHSTPEEIRAQFGTSKKAFKQALGALYRQRSIRMIEGGIEWVRPADEAR